MEFNSPLFGMLSGLCTSMWLLIHVAVLGIFLISGANPSVSSLIIFTVLSKMLAEKLFWKRAIDRMDEAGLGNWRDLINRDLILHSNVWMSFLMIFADILLDIVLIYTAFKTSLSPVLILFIFLGCQLLCAPFQGLISDYFNKKKSLFFAIVIGILVFLASGQVFSEGWDEHPSLGLLIIRLLYLSSCNPGVQMIVLLCLKGSLGNITVIARSCIARIVALEAIDEKERQQG